MSGIATDRIREEKNRHMEAFGFQKLQAAIKHSLKENPKFHGHFVLTFTLFDGVMTNHKVGQEEITKTE